MPETTLAFVDLGYLGILKFHENSFIPAKNSKNRRLSEYDKQLNKEMSTIRIEIEHFNAKFKTFQIMSVPYRNRRKRFELLSKLICAIINYSENSIPNKSIVYVLSLESDTNTSVFSTACPLCFPHNEAGLENK